MDYLTVYFEKESFGELEVCVAILDHGVGYWEFWSDTGYEFVESSDPDLVFQEALDDNGNSVQLTKDEIEKVLDIAMEYYWEKGLDRQIEI